MTEDLGSARIRLEVDATRMRSGINTAMGYMSSLEEIVAKNWWAVQSLGNGFAKLPMAVGAGVAGAIAAATKWEDAMAGVEKTTYDASKSNEENTRTLARLDSQLLDLSSRKPIPAVEIAGIAESLGALGVMERDLVGITEVVVDFAATTDVAAGEASTSLVRLASLTNMPTSGIDNMASAIMEAGRTSAATEGEILEMATGLAGLAASFGLTTAETIGWGNALANVNIRAELGRTQMTKTFGDVQRAVSENGEQLKVWAKLAGESGASFSELFRTDASTAMQQVINGLAGMMEQGLDLTGVLDEVGVREQRQIHVLTQLAAAQNQTSNEGMTLSSTLKTARDEMVNGTTMAEIAAKRYETFAAQLEILKNKLFALASEMGKSLVPVLKVAVSVLGAMAAMFAAIPSPIRNTLAVLVLVVAAFSGLAAVTLLVGRRVILAYTAINKLTGIYKAARLAAIQQAAAEAAAAKTADAEAAAAARVAAARVALAKARATDAKMQAALKAASAAASKAEVAYAMQEMRVASARVVMARATAEAKMAAHLSPALSAQVLQKAEMALAKEEAALLVLSGDLAAANAVMAMAYAAAAKAADELSEEQRELGASLAVSTLASNQSSAAQAKLAATSAATGAASKGAASGGILQMIAGMLGLKKGGAGASKGLSGLISKITSLGKAGAIGAAVMATAAVALHAYNTQLKDIDKETKRLQAANENLVKIILDSGDAAGKAANEWIKFVIAQSGMIDTAKKVGISVEELARAISGSSTAKEYETIIKKISDANKKGVEGSKEFGYWLRNTQMSVAASKDEAVIAGAKTVDLADSMDKASRSSGKLAESQMGLEEANRRVAASQDLISNYYATMEASFAVVDAEAELAAARVRGGGTSAAVARAELGLTEARRSASSLVKDIRDAERALATARTRQAEAVKKAEISLADAQDSRLSAIEDMRVAQENLEEARKSKGTQELRDAVISLAEAEKTLRDAQQGSADAQWYLNYLRQEGAGARDIKVAENAIKDAALDVTKATEGKTKAQKDYDRLSGANGRAKAERDLAAATRKVESSTIAVKEAERELSDVRDAAANDTAFLEAQYDLLELTQQQKEAAYDLADAEAELASARSSPGRNDLARAEFGYDQAIIDSAKAAADLRKALAENNGEIVDASEYSKMFGEELEKAIEGMPIDDSIRRLKFMIGLLKKVPELPDSDIDNLVTGELGEGFASVDPLKDLEISGSDKRKSAWRGFWDDFGTGVGMLPDLPGEIQGWLYRVGKNIQDGLLGGLKTGWDTVYRWVTGAIGGLINWIKKLLGINSPSTVMKEIGGYIMEGLKNGIAEFWDKNLWPFISGIPGKILGVFVGAATWLFNAGVSVVGGMWDGLKNGWEIVKEWFGSLKEMILGIFSGAGGWLKDVGKQIVSGLMDVVIKVWDKIPSVVRSKIPGIKEIDKMIQDYKELTGVKGELTKAVGTAMSKVPAASKYNGNDARMQTMARETMEATPSSWFAPKGTKTLGGLPTAPVNTTTTYNLNAITTADPKEIMNEFAWAESIRTRGSS